eukprot:3884113-Rhodomonas_salina.2
MVLRDVCTEADHGATLLLRDVRYCNSVSAMPRSVLRQRMVLRLCYAVSSTELGYGATSGGGSLPEMRLRADGYTTPFLRDVRY